jgi:SanA protein
MKRSRRLRRWVPLCIVALFLAAAFTAAVNVWLVNHTAGRIFDEIEKLPGRDVAVVLGTAPRVRDRWSNPFFESRMDSAAALWKAGKARAFIVSGDNSRRDYDEPTAMRDALIKRGVPEGAITLDYAGFRTLDTMARARAVFGQQSIIVVTDDFHLARSVFLAEAHGIEAVGFRGKPVPAEWSRKARFREVFSRVKAWLDVYVLGTKPKFRGPPVHVALHDRG